MCVVCVGREGKEKHGWERGEPCFIPWGGAITQLFGCHIWEINLISGGRLGKVSGNFSSALKNPPSTLVPGGPTIIIVQWNRLSSFKPTLTPSGGDFVSSEEQGTEWLGQNKRGWLAQKKSVTALGQMTFEKRGDPHKTLTKVKQHTLKLTL